MDEQNTQTKATNKSKWIKISILQIINLYFAIWTTSNATFGPSNDTAAFAVAMILFELIIMSTISAVMFRKISRRWYFLIIGYFVSIVVFVAGCLVVTSLEDVYKAAEQKKYDRSINLVIDNQTKLVTKKKIGQPLDFDMIEKNWYDEDTASISGFTPITSENTDDIIVSQDGQYLLIIRQKDKSYNAAKKLEIYQKNNTTYTTLDFCSQAISLNLTCATDYITQKNDEIIFSINFSKYSRAYNELLTFNKNKYYELNYNLKTQQMHISEAFHNY